MNSSSMLRAAGKTTAIIGPTCFDRSLDDENEEQKSDEQLIHGVRFPVPFPVPVRIRCSLTDINAPASW